MCNLNIIIKARKTEQNPNGILGFLMGVTTNSYIRNSDGDGIYLSATNKLDKSFNKLNIFDYQKDVKHSKYIISHQRIATSGFESDYLQPFQDEKNEFVLAHNGVINDFKEKKGSDTYGFFQKFLVAFELMEGIDRSEKIVSTIKGLLDYQSGSFSIAIFDKIEEKLYYFKNSRTDMVVFLSKESDVMYMTTDKDNKAFLSMTGLNFNELKVEDYNIYQIYTENDKIIHKLKGEIKPVYQTYQHLREYIPLTNRYSSSHGWQRDSLSNKKKVSDKEFIFGKKKGKHTKLTKKEKKLLKEINDEIEFEQRMEKKIRAELITPKDIEQRINLKSDGDLGFYPVADANQCGQCRELTHSKNLFTGEFLCEECIEEQRIELTAEFNDDFLAYYSIYNQRGRYYDPQFV